MRMKTERSVLHALLGPLQAPVNPFARSLIILLLMGMALIISVIAHPRADPSPTQVTEFERLVPRAFGEWRVIEAPMVSVVNPQQQQVLDSTYRQVITRVYQHLPTGDLLMMSLAYGDAQKKETQVHLPERCYPAQGFEVRNSWKHDLLFSEVTIPAQRMIAERGAQREAVTYWIRLGATVVRGDVAQKIHTVLEGLRGRVADGLIFRVSSVGMDDQEGFGMQERFVADLISTIPDEVRYLLIGAVQ